MLLRPFDDRVAVHGDLSRESGERGKVVREGGVLSLLVLVLAGDDGAVRADYRVVTISERYYVGRVGGSKMTTPDVRDSRKAERFIADRPIEGHFGGTDVTIWDLAESGLQMEHAEPLKIATKGRVGFKLDEMTVTVPGIVIWSRLSQTPDARGRLLYRSGVRLEADIELFATAINVLAGSGRIRRDVASLERKRTKLQQREQQKELRPIVRQVQSTPNLPPDQVLLVQHARDRLRDNPNEATKWYNRAKYSLAEGSFTNIPHREEVLAVWEYLECSIDIQTIIAIFPLKR